MFKKIILIAIVFVGNSVVAQNRIQFLPKTERITDNSLSKFIDTLKAVVARKDVAKIYTLLDKKIINSFGDADGIVNFKKIWQPHKTDELWKVLTGLFSFGGQFTTDYDTKVKSKTEYVYPYFFDEEIAGEENYSDLYVVKGADKNMRINATTESEIITSLSFEAVKLIDSSSAKYKNGWVYVQTLDGSHKGYMKETLLHNFIDYRMFIKKQKNNWKISILVAGD